MDVSSPSAPRRRFSLLTGPWHTSSRVVAVLTLLFLVFCNVPGQVAHDFNAIGDYFPYSDSGLISRMEHGWPFAWNVRLGIQSWGGVRPTAAGCWKFWDDDPSYSWTKLGANAGVALLLSAMAGAAFELWRQSRSRLYQWHLRDAFGLVLLTSIILAWYANEQRRNTQEERLVAYNERSGSSPNGINSYEETMGGFTWMRTLVGDRPFRFLDRVWAVDIDSLGFPLAAELPDVRLVRVRGAVTSGDLRQLERMPKLQALDFDPPYGGVRSIRIHSRQSPDSRKATLFIPSLVGLRQLDLSGTDCRFEGIENLKNLEMLRVSNVYADKPLLKAIAGLKQLQRVDLSFSRIPPRGLGHFAALPELTHLNLMGTEINDDDAKDLEKLTELRELDLYQCPLTNHALTHLSKLSKLESLDLSEVNIDDGGLSPLVELPNLRILDLSGTDVTSQSLAALKKFQQLRFLKLPGPPFTVTDRANLESALAECHINYQDY